MRMVIVVSTLALSGPSMALMCQPTAPEDIARIAEIAFVGVVTGVEESPYQPSGSCWAQTVLKPTCGGKLASFQISETLRGKPGVAATVLTEDACYCLGHYWKVGASYLVVARANSGDAKGDLIASNVCGGAGPIGVETESVIEALRVPNS